MWYHTNDDLSSVSVSLQSDLRMLQFFRRFVERTFVPAAHQPAGGSRSSQCEYDLFARTDNVRIRLVMIISTKTSGTTLRSESVRYNPIVSAILQHCANCNVRNRKWTAYTSLICDDELMILAASTPFTIITYWVTTLGKISVIKVITMVAQSNKVRSRIGS